MWCPSSRQLLLSFTALSAMCVAEDCELGAFGCYSEGGNQIGPILSGLTSSADCLAACTPASGCQYYTYYGVNHNAQLSQVCLLFASCRRHNTKCSNCTTGSRSCGPCAVPPTRGGHHFCPGGTGGGETAAGTSVAELTACPYTCGQLLVTRQCVNGSWVGGDATCPCLGQPTGDQLVCSSPAGRYGTSWAGGTVCQKMCGTDRQEPAGQTVCRDGIWDTDLSQVTCSSQDDTIIVIVLAVVGGLAVILLIGGSVTLLLYRRRRSRTGKTDRNPPIQGFGSISTDTVRKKARPDVLYLPSVQQPGQRSNWQDELDIDRLKTWIGEDRPKRTDRQRAAARYDISQDEMLPGYDIIQPGKLPGYHTIQPRQVPGYDTYRPGRSGNRTNPPARRAGRPA